MQEVVGLSVASVGWIPHYSEEPPAGALREHWNDSAALPWLFKTGNTRPYDHYSDSKEFAGYLELNDFRAAIAIEAPTLQLDSNGDPVSIEFGHMARIGYTPVPAWPGRWNFDGIGSAGGLIQVEAGVVLIRLFVRFKLSLKGQVLAKVVAGHWPPNATMTIDYRLQPVYRSAEIHFKGTSVPSVRSYVDWRVTDEHRVEDLSWESFHGFMTSVGCQDALEERSSKRRINLL